MKYSVKSQGSIGFDAKATDNAVGIISNIWKKISGIVNKDDSTKVEKPESGITTNGSLNWEVEASAEISVEEMTELYKLAKEYDIHAWEVLKTAGKDIIKGSRSLLNAFKEQSPEWIDAIHTADLKYEDNEKELELHKFKNEREIEAEIKKYGWTRKGRSWYEHESDGRKTTVRSEVKKESHKGSFDNFNDEE